MPESILHKFPHLQPVKSVPSLFRINGFGVGMYGKRGFDNETSTHTKTYCICALFIPLFALRAYRVADAECEEFLKLPAVAEHELTRDYVTVALLGLQQNAWVYRSELDGRQLLAVAQAAKRRPQSAASRHALKSVLFFCAPQDLSRQSPNYAALTARTRRGVAPQYPITFLLERGGALADQALRNENAIAALEIQKRWVADFPSWADINAWAFLKASDPNLAATVAKRLKENEAVQLTAELDFEFSPLSASAVLERYWMLRMLGDEARAGRV